MSTSAPPRLATPSSNAPSTITITLLPSQHMRCTMALQAKLVLDRFLARHIPNFRPSDAGSARLTLPPGGASDVAWELRDNLLLVTLREAPTPYRGMHRQALTSLEYDMLAAGIEYVLGGKSACILPSDFCSTERFLIGLNSVLSSRQLDLTDYTIGLDYNETRYASNNGGQKWSIRLSWRQHDIPSTLEVICESSPFNDAAEQRLLEDICAASSSRPLAFVDLLGNY